MNDRHDRNRGPDPHLLALAAVIAPLVLAALAGAGWMVIRVLVG